uniref:AB hydrolase-1 domain-containing protein n=1 Tax=Setaria digitata TaxID=48799 RepID=A0A915Q430_9BILA
MIWFTILFYTLLPRNLAIKELLAEDLNLLSKPLNPLIAANAVNVVVKSDTKALGNKMTVYYLEASPPSTTKYRGDLLYLHGAAFSSHDWNKNKPSILQMSAAAGYRTIAIDLPGFSYSRSTGTAANDRITFMSSVMESLRIHKPVIVSPSASGSYSVPYVLKNQKKISGFVPVAPCCVHSDAWNNFTVPTLVVYGSEDRASISKGLLQIPNRNLVIIPDAPHAAYIKKPVDFVTALINFMYTIHPRVFN